MRTDTCRRGRFPTAVLRARHVAIVSDAVVPLGASRVLSTTCHTRRAAYCVQSILPRLSPCHPRASPQSLDTPHRSYSIAPHLQGSHGIIGQHTPKHWLPCDNALRRFQHVGSHACWILTDHFPPTCYSNPAQAQCADSIAC